MYCGYARRLEICFKIKIEIRRIDGYKYRGAFPEEMFFQLAPDADDLAVMPQHLDITPHREFFQGKQRLDAGGHHVLAADADESCSRHTFAQSLHQCPAQQIARGLTRNNSDQRTRRFFPWRHGGQRMMPRPGVARNAASCSNAGCVAASVAICATAASKDSPDLYSVL